MGGRNHLEVVAGDSLMRLHPILRQMWTTQFPAQIRRIVFSSRILKLARSKLESGDQADVPSSPPEFAAGIVLLAPVVVSVICFFTARWIGLSRGWLYLCNFALIHLFGWMCVQRWNPIVISRRNRIGGNTKRWDIAVLIALSVGIAATIFTATNTAAAREAATSEPGVPWLIGAAVFAVGLGVMLWCSIVNPFLEKTVRIQTDNQHRVIETGPYAFVRHPMYVGLMAILLATPMMLGTWWLLLPIGWCAAVLIVRTALEDRTLQTELSGYTEYSERVRYRLVPGLW